MRSVAGTIRASFTVAACVIAAACAPRMHDGSQASAPARQCLSAEESPARWNPVLVNGRVTVWFANTLNANAAAAARQAADDWNSIRLPIRFVRVNQERDAAVRVQFVRTLPAATGRESPSGVARLTFDRERILSSVDVMLASETPNGIHYAPTDLYVSAIHELGHALGVPHASESHLAMAAFSRAIGFTPGDAQLARDAYAPRGKECAALRVAGRN
jgi:predicted Zn-dependent protease